MKDGGFGRAIVLWGMGAIAILLLGMFIWGWQSAVSANNLQTAITDIGPGGSGGGVYEPGHVPHLSPAQRQEIEQTIAANIDRLAAAGQLPPLQAESTLTLNWPLSHTNPVTSDFGYHGISNFVDHDPLFPNQRLDYNCGNRTYDLPSGYNHRGTDFFLWPFPWNTMDAGEVAVVAAAPGLIIHKQDGYYDRSCSFTGQPWNAVYILHADGSKAWYGHLKQGSVLTKSVGEAVAAGEYLGLVGSSGNSTGPHLHLELFDSAGQMLDPYAGSCNPTITVSWWDEQRPYYDSAVNKITTGSAAPYFPPCPANEVTNEQTVFAPGSDIYFTTYYRDQLGSQTSHYALYMPDGDLYYQWSHNSNANHYAASYWWWWFHMGTDSPRGQWCFRVTFAGQTYSHSFYILDPVTPTATPSPTLQPPTSDTDFVYLPYVGKLKVAGCH
jgi:murein DD-endopeptidase MepM/ murein hydrolase activator NlpD